MTTGIESTATGMESAISVSEAGITEIKRILETQNLKGYALRLGVKGGGCSGLSYTLGFDNEVRPQDKIIETDGVKVVVDMKSLLYLKGTTLDFSQDMMGGGFRFVNPNAQRSCGCGSSFSA